MHHNSNKGSAFPQISSAEASGCYLEGRGNTAAILETTYGGNINKLILFISLLLIFKSIFTIYLLYNYIYVNGFEKRNFIAQKIEMEICVT